MRIMRSWLKLRLILIAKSSGRPTFIGYLQQLELNAISDQYSNKHKFSCMVSSTVKSFFKNDQL